MRIGILKEKKQGENSVIATPSEVATFVFDGHEVYVEKGAGLRSGFSDDEYESAGGIILNGDEIFSNCDLIAKVKEVEPSEYGKLRENQIIFTCIHPAANNEEVQALLDHKVISFAAEETHRHGSPNCEAAGKAGVLLGLHSLMTIGGGMGKFVSGLGAAPGVSALVLGCGTVGSAAIEVLCSLGAWVTVAATNVGHLRQIGSQYDGRVNTMISNRYNITKLLPDVDMVINCVRWPKDAEKYLIDREMVRKMRKGSVIVDISNDYGVIETFHETTHDNPTYIEEGVVHYCVSNIPSAIAQTASIAYAASVQEHLRSILNNGVKKACISDGYLRRGLVTYKGYLTHEETSKIQNRPWIQPETILGIEKEELDPAPKNTSTVSDNYYEHISLDE